MDDYGGTLHRDFPTSEAAAHPSDVLRMDRITSDVSVESILDNYSKRQIMSYAQPRSSMPTELTLRKFSFSLIPQS
jgi:hypothetical protein